MKQAATYRNILKAVSLFTGVQGLNILLNLVRGKLAAVLLGPTGIGLNSMYNEVRELIHETTNIGLDKSGVREVSRAYGERSKEGGASQLKSAITLTRSWVMSLALLGTIVTLAASPALSYIFFDDLDHALHFALLSPAIGLSTITCGEMIILRGIQKLKTIAIVSVLNVAGGIITTIPVYYCYGIQGIVPALVLMTLFMAIITTAISYRIHRPEFCFQPRFLSGGKTMLLIGLSFVISGIIAHASKLYVQKYLSNATGYDTVGYYSQILAIMTYGAIILSSVDTDYFPRLSSIFDNLKTRIETVHRQHEITLAVTLPVTVTLIFTLPVIVPLLLSNDFAPIITATQIVAVSLLCRAIYIPTAIIPLAAGDSKIYLLMQSISYICFIPAIIAGYEYYGVTGIGIGLALSNLFDLICTLICAKYRYQTLPSRYTATSFTHKALIGILAFILAIRLEGTPYWLTAIALITMTTGGAIYEIRKMIKTDE